MSTYYVNLEAGADMNDGTTWAKAKKSIYGGTGVASAGDTVKIGKSPAPFSLGDATWTVNTLVGGSMPATLAITATASNSGPVQLTTASTSTLATNNIVHVAGLVGTVEANGTWKIIVDDATHITLVGSTYANARVSGGTITKVDTKAVVLSGDALTKNICSCDVIWSVDNTSTITLDPAPKAGYGDVKIVKASPSNSTLYAHYTIPEINLTDYQSISFWIKNITAIAADTTWSICLCSDTAGATVVDTFLIPPIPCINFWLPLNLTRVGGGNLDDSIQSIALYSGSSAASTSGIQIDNVIATKTNSLNLQSLISQNSADKDGTGAWYPIQSIDPTGKIILVDGPSNTSATAGRGYGGTTGGLVATYARNTIKTALTSNDTGQIQTVYRDGSAGSLIYIEGGYNSSTDSLDGETIIDGLTGLGVGTWVDKKYISFNHLGFVRYYHGFMTSSACIPMWINNFNIGCGNAQYALNLASAGNTTITTIGYLVGNGVGLYLSSANTFTVGTVKGCDSNNSAGMNVNTCQSGKITTIGTLNNNGANGLTLIGNSNSIGSITSASYNTGIGVSLGTGSNNTISTVTASSSNTTYGLTMEGYNNRISTLNCTANTTADVYNRYGINYLRSATLGSTNWAGTTVAYDARVYSEKHGNAANTHYVYTDYGYITTAAAGDGTGWKTYVTNVGRAATYPVSLDIATIYCAANRPIIVYVTASKSHASDIAAQIIIPGGQIAGVDTDQTSVLASNTNEQTLSIPITPTAAGTVTVKLQTWWLANTADEYSTCYNIRTNARKYGKVYLQDTKAYVEFNYVVKYDTETTNPYITEATQATAHAYTGIAINDSTGMITVTANHTIQELYDYIQDYLSLNPLVADFFYTTDGITYTCAYDMTVDDVTLTATNKILDLGSNELTLVDDGAVSALRVTDVNGTLVSISLSNVVTGSQCYVEKTSDHTEYMNTTASGTTAAVNYTHTGDVAVTVRVRKAGYQEWTTTGTITTSGLSLTVGQASDATY
jgi:hypothetical protein